MSDCLYQGTFNPIHNAHLMVAEFAHKIFKFDKIIFIPAFKPPHKDIKNYSVENAMHRLEMVQIAIKNTPYFDVSAIEYTRNSPSYTYDTVKQIISITKEEKLNFIIGTDAFIQIETWYRTDELKNLLNFILFVRENNFDETPFEKLRKKGYNYNLMKMPYVDISSSEIRKRCLENEQISKLVPIGVEEYIRKNDLYKIYN